MPDIFDEIDDDLRAERVKRLLNRYGVLIIALVVAAIAGGGGWAWWSNRQATNALRVSDDYIAAVRAATGAGPGHAQAIADLAGIAAMDSEGYRTLARLRAAALKADSGDLPGALSLWDAVAADTAADPILRGLANLQWANHQIDTGDADLVAVRLRPLAAPDNPWHALAEEAQAMLAIRLGKTDMARDTLKQLTQDVTAPDGVRGRANGLLELLGGS